MNGIITALVAALSIMIAIFPEVSLLCAREALELCANVLIPSLLPFFICSSLLVALGVGRRLSKSLAGIMKPIFGVCGAGALPLVMGLISGYPCGAATTCRLYEEGALTKNEAHRLLAFTNNSGPLFIISAVGIGIYGSKSAGLLLYISHLAGAVLTGIIFRPSIKEIKTDKKEMKYDKKPITQAISDSISSVIGLCGYVIFFAVLLGMMKKVGIIDIFSQALMLLGIDDASARLLSSGFFEITSGLFKSGSKNLPYTCAVISFGGLSVFMQTFSLIRKSRLSVKSYVIGKLSCGVLGALVMKLLMELFPVDLTVFAPSSNSGAFAYVNYLAAFVTAFFVFIIFYVCGLSKK